jgi:DNA-binding MltR family transcriptional regulator
MKRTRRDLTDTLEKGFKEESDRAVVILVGALLDNALSALLKSRLVASSSDSLFDGVNAPLSTFSARIDMAYRLGLISHQLSADLHLIKRIRNDFAHNVEGASFNDANIRDRVMLLSRASHIYERSVEYREKQFGGTDHRHNFLAVCHWILWYLDNLADRVERLREEKVEMGYDLEWMKEHWTGFFEENEPQSKKGVSKNGKKQVSKEGKLD